MLQIGEFSVGSGLALTSRVRQFVIHRVEIEYSPDHVIFSAGASCQSKNPQKQDDLFDEALVS